MTGILALAWAHKKLAGLALLAVLALAAGGYAWLTIAHLRADVATAQAGAATAKADLATMTADRDQLVAAIQQANAAAEAARTAAQALEAQAQQAYADSAKASSARRAVIATAPGTGPGAMNAFLLNVFSAGGGKK